MNPSREPDERLADWVDGRLSAAELAALEHEFERDPEFADQALSYRATVELLRRSEGELERAPRGMADAVLESLEREVASDALPRWQPRAATFSLIAATLIIGLGIALYVLPTSAPRVRDTAKGDAPMAQPGRDFTGDLEAGLGRVTGGGAAAPEPEERREADTALADDSRMRAARPQTQTRLVAPPAAVSAPGQPESKVAEKAEEESFVGGTELRGADQLGLQLSATAIEPPAEGDALEEQLRHAFRRVQAEAPSASADDKVSAGRAGARTEVAEVGMLAVVITVPVDQDGGVDRVDEFADNAEGADRDRMVGGWVQPPLSGFANTLPPRVDEVAGLAPAPGERTNEQGAAAMPTPSTFLPGDRVFAVEGTPEQLARYFALLRARAAEQGAGVDLVRTAPGTPGPSSWVRFGVAPTNLGQQAKDEASTDGDVGVVLLVLRERRG